MTKDQTIIEIIDAGLQTTIQDSGRLGFRSYGIANSGAIDPRLLILANSLLRQDVNYPSLEFCLNGLSLKVLAGSIFVAICGNCEAQIEKVGKTVKVAPFSSFKLEENDKLEISKLKNTSYGYISFSGKMQIDKQLGSYSTDLQSGFGGFFGRALKANDQIVIQPNLSQPTNSKLDAVDLILASQTIRIIKGPDASEFDSFLDLNQNYQITNHKNRMGVRLKGSHIYPRDKNLSLVSEAQAIGTIQIAGDGLPIILLNDAQTIGGYPKIATVIAADIAKFAQLPPFSNVSFVEVDIKSAKKLYSDYLKQLTSIQESITFDND